MMIRDRPLFGSSWKYNIPIQYREGPLFEKYSLNTWANLINMFAQAYMRVLINCNIFILRFRRGLV